MDNLVTLTTPSPDIHAADFDAAAAAPPPRRGRVLIAGRCAETIYRQRRLLAASLRDAGWEVHLCGDGREPRHIAALEAEGFAFHPIALDQRKGGVIDALRLVGCYFRLCRSLRPEVVHVFNAKPTIMGLLGSGLAGVPVRIATIAGLGHGFLTRSPFLRLATWMAFRISLRFATKVVFYNGDDRAIFLRRGLVSDHKVALIPGSGVDLSRFLEAPLPESDTLEVLFIGRLLREKGIDVVIAAGDELRRRHARVRITVVGDLDPHNPSSLSHADIAAAVARGAVVWLGSLHDVAPEIAKTHVILLPSLREGIPLALVEGGALGRALVATDVPGCRDVVDHEVNGLLVPPGDSEAVVDALSSLATDRASLARFASAAARSVRERFDTSVVSAQVLELYASLLRPRSAR